MDRSSTIMLCRVVPGIGLTSFAFSLPWRRTPYLSEIKVLISVSGAAESSVAPLPFRCRSGKGGKLRLIVKRA